LEEDVQILHFVFYPTDTVDIYDTKTLTWFTARLSTPRGFLAAASAGHYLLFAGGLSASVDHSTTMPSNVVDIYDCSANTWSVSMLPTVLYGTAGTSSNNLIIFGGGSDDNTISTTDIDLYNINPASIFIPTTTGNPASHSGVYPTTFSFVLLFITLAIFGGM